MKECVLLDRVELWKGLDHKFICQHWGMWWRTSGIFGDGHYRLPTANRVFFQLASSEISFQMWYGNWRGHISHTFLCGSGVTNHIISVEASWASTQQLRKSGAPACQLTFFVWLESSLSHITCSVQVQVLAFRYHWLYKQSYQSHPEPWAYTSSGSGPLAKS